MECEQLVQRANFCQLALKEAINTKVHLLFQACTVNVYSLCSITEHEQLRQLFVLLVWLDFVCLVMTWVIDQTTFY